MSAHDLPPAVIKVDDDHENGSELHPLEEGLNAAEHHDTAGLEEILSDINS